ncbi:hypothetical protein GTP81_24170 [Rugamonas sp. FT107W]|uniref:Uncharacterized protein n=1 Tax=Duganella vulcania TaxID=2692166 RepID=A0A845HQR3_9BURK|nr:hypothetical protein [Duganella vulcania]MYN19845.1 hypothetical protein [Duganella vulcania]
MKIDTKALGSASAAAFATSRKSGADFKAVLETKQQPSQPTAAQELDTYMKKSPAERMAEMILKSLGETPESLAAKSPAEQASIMAKVAALIKQKMEEATAKANGGGDGGGASGVTGVNVSA